MIQMKTVTELVMLHSKKATLQAEVVMVLMKTVTTQAVAAHVSAELDCCLLRSELLLVPCTSGERGYRKGGSR